ncbi:MAG: hypothetical protein ACK4TA_05290 [Saprospiraceae bacterium]
MGLLKSPEPSVKTTSAIYFRGAGFILLALYRLQAHQDKLFIYSSLRSIEKASCIRFFQLHLCWQLKPEFIRI